MSALRRPGRPPLLHIAVERGENKEFTLKRAKVVERFLPTRKAMDINEQNCIPFVKSLEYSIESQTTVSDLAAVTAPVEVVCGDLDEFQSEGVMKDRGAAERRHRAQGTRHRSPDRHAAGTGRRDRDRLNRRIPISGSAS